MAWMSGRLLERIGKEGGAKRALAKDKATAEKLVVLTRRRTSLPRLLHPASSLLLTETEGKL